MLKAYHKTEGTLTIYGTEKRGYHTYFFVYLVDEWVWINANEFEAGDDE